MFRNAKSSKGWDSTSEVIEDEIRDKTMKAIDFHVGEMQDPHRAAIYIHARNCCTGRSVWVSPRLPRDPVERTVILLEAKNDLMRRLLSAGVM
jgi:Cft2 family RNA processing exonuclease